MREIVSPLSGFASPFGAARAGGGSGWLPSITSSDGETASLVDNGDDTVDVVINSVTVGTITRAQVEAGGFITVVEPVVGMSGNNVVLTTTGYVIHVGTTPIETNVEVLADGVVVGAALPFDATAQTDKRLDVRFSYSVGSDTLVQTLNARLAVLRRVLFRNSYAGLSSDPSGTATGTPWTLANATRQFTLAMRFEGLINNVDVPGGGTPRSMDVIWAGGCFLRVDRFASAGSRLRVRADTESGSFTPDITIPAADGSRVVSVLIAVDLNGGLPGGEVLTVWASVGGAAGARIAGHTTLPASPTVLCRGRVIGNSGLNGTNIGGDIDVHNHVWAANVALDPATNWSNFFNSNGTVKDLGVTGVVNGVTPVIYLVKDDFVTRNNRGSGGGQLGVNASRNAITIGSAL